MPESDGTLKWDKTAIVVEIQAGNPRGTGYTYADTAAAKLIQSKLAKVIAGQDAMSPSSLYMRMWHESRNLGRPGIVLTAISAARDWNLNRRMRSSMPPDAGFGASLSPNRTIS